VLDKQLNDNKSGIAVFYILEFEVCHRLILVVVVDILFNYCLQIIFFNSFFTLYVVCVQIFCFVFVFL